MKSLLAATLLVGGLMPLAGDAVQVKVGDPAPDMSGKWLDYQPANAKLADLQGKVVLMEFWRTW